MSIILDDVQRLDRLISDISDASRLDAELSRAETDTVELGELLHALVEVQEAGERVVGPCFRLDVLDHQDLAVPGIGGRLGQAFRKIGRASCRERVCQTGSLSVVAVSLKKKTH